MRIVHLAAGAAGSYCGACARDAALARGLRARGHDVLFLPLYTPVRTDGPDPSFRRVFYGGLRTWLQQHVALFRRAPRLVGWLLDRPALLRLLGRFAIETRPEDLGPMTVSVLRGQHGHQRQALDELVAFLAAQERPHVVALTNSLLVGVVPAIKERLGVPVACALQGEEDFLDRLGEPHRAQAWALVRQHARLVDRFLAPSEDYAQEMAPRLGVDRGPLRVVRPGVPLEPYANAGPRVRQPFRIGFLSRISAAKGLDVLCEAFRELERRRPGRAALAVAGQMTAAGRRLWRRLDAGLARGGLAHCVTFHGEVDLAGKAAFLRACSVFCLPSRVVERRGMAVLEAMAAGVPAVVPGRGVFREMLALTGGGVAVESAEPRAWAAALASLLDEPEQADRLGRAAAAGVAEHYSADCMVASTLTVYEELLGRSEFP